MDFKDNSLDLIITTATAHHLPYAWLLEFAKDKLKKGGRTLDFGPARPSSLPDFSYGLRRFRLTDYEPY
jgi:hypothetical protein